MKKYVFAVYPLGLSLKIFTKSYLFIEVKLLEKKLPQLRLPTVSLKVAIEIWLPLSGFTVVGLRICSTNIIVLC